jgi:2-keto-4-pentenoate hydratase/2-oxohepta-3-ene-1,7-dioic acid hydratase in catechol pathway
VRWCRFSADGQIKGYGLVEAADGQVTVAGVDGTPFTGFTLTGQRWALGAVRLLAPVVPTKVLCVGKNYADHAREMGGEAPADPVIFAKPSTAVIGPGDPIVHPRDSDQVDFEGELAVVIGSLCRDVPAARAHEVVLGYTVANDVTARDHQRQDGQWTRGKGHDSFCPLGPWIETELDPSDLAITTELDGELRQASRTSMMLHDVAQVVAWVSAFCTLIPGDVLLTGTPAGVGPMTPGQRVSVTVEGIGTLHNPVVAR